MMNAKIEYHRKRVALVNMLNIPPGIQLVSTDTLLAPLTLVAEKEGVKENDSLYSNRPEFQSANLMLQSLQTEKRTSTTGLWLPELHVGTYTSMFGDVISPLYPTSAINASLLWRIPIGRLTYQGKLKQYNAKIAIQETEIEQVKTQVHNEVLIEREIMNVAEEQMEFAKEGSFLANKALFQSMER